MSLNIDDAKKIVIEVIKSTLENKSEVTEDTQLIAGVLDSMKLVEVCLALDDLADDKGFEFDWTSEATMSKSSCMFRTVTSLAEEFATQSEA